MDLKYKHFILPLLLSLAGLIIGSIGSIDMTISQSLYIKDNVFSLICATFGMIPIYGLLAFFGMYIIPLGLKAEKRKFWLTMIIILGIGMFVFGSYKLADDFTSINGFNVPQFKWPVAFPCALLFFSLVGHFGYRYGKHSNNEHLLWGLIIAIISCIVVIGISMLIKIIMHRPRFRAICNSDYGIPFYNWFLRCGDYKNYMSIYNLPSEEFKAFPSGHAGFSMFLTFCITMFPALGMKKIKHTTLAFYICFIYSLVIAFSRLLAGAHFLSDVSFGILLTTLMFVAVKAYLDRHPKLEIKIKAK